MLPMVDMETCKVYFPVETTREEAEKLIRQYSKSAEIANFYSKRQIGCNTHTFAVTTLPFDCLSFMERNGAILKVETVESFTVRASNAECCKAPSGCCP